MTEKSGACRIKGHTMEIETANAYKIDYGCSRPSLIRLWCFIFEFLPMKRFAVA